MDSLEPTKKPGESAAFESAGTGGLSPGLLHRFGHPSAWSSRTCVRLTGAFCRARPGVSAGLTLAAMGLVALATTGFWFLLAAPLMFSVYLYAAAQVRAFLGGTGAGGSGWVPRDGAAAASLAAALLFPWLALMVLAMGWTAFVLLLGLNPLVLAGVGVPATLGLAVAWVALSTAPLEVLLFGRSYLEAHHFLRSMIRIRKAPAVSLFLVDFGLPVGVMLAIFGAVLSLSASPRVSGDTLAKIAPALPWVFVGGAKAFAWVFSALAYFRLRGGITDE